jgi:hypothetical protein
MDKLPPIYKIPEAFSAVADGRITIEENKATIMSSDYTKRYTVEFDGDVYASNDNATYWQGYAGYPIIAMLILQDRLEYDKNVIAHFKGINWTEQNKKHKKKYDKALEEVLNDLQQNDIDIENIKKEIEDVYNQLIKLPLKIKRCGKKVERL